MAKKIIEDIYVEYFQKSRVFLYPALDIKKGCSVTPIETYLSWGDEIKITDNKLVCLYYLRDDDEFVQYEERYLLQNPLFEDFKEVDSGKAIYIFDFSSYAEDFNHVVNARYSQLSQTLKNKIRDMYGANSNNFAYVKTYLYPEQYYDVYAEILSPQKQYIEEMRAILEETGELCSPPNFSKEMLEICVKSLKL